MLGDCESRRQRPCPPGVWRIPRSSRRRGHRARPLLTELGLAGQVRDQRRGGRRKRDVSAVEDDGKLVGERELRGGGVGRLAGCQRCACSSRTEQQRFRAPVDAPRVGQDERAAAEDTERAPAAPNPE